ncbi:MAG: VOC family protein [Bacillota bacterium]|nr:VOC family protein [Bacillota bacterium]
MCDYKNLFSGLQHIGIPTEDINATISFYTGLGFSLAWKTPEDSAAPVAFLQRCDLVIETYAQKHCPVGNGSLDHFALQCSDAEALFKAFKDEDYAMLDSSVSFLPFYERGVKFFRIKGPNGETIEFNQIL